MIKIDRERLSVIVCDRCDNIPCNECKYFKHKSTCRMHYIADILEQNPDLITGLPQTEQVPLPVKNTWTLKREYQQFCKDYYISMPFEFEVEPKQHKEYYYVTETLDYSQIPVGASIEINNFEVQGLVVENNGEMIGVRTWNGECCTTYKDLSKLESLTILKMPKDIK